MRYIPPGAEILPSHIYGSACKHIVKEEIKAYILVDFRPVKVGELCLNENFFVVTAQINSSSPLFILQQRKLAINFEDAWE